MRRHALAPLVLSLLLLGGTSHAQWVELWGFEEGSVTDAGFFEQTALQQVTRTVTPAAARRGTYGFRFTDTDPLDAVGETGALARSVPVSPSLYTRAWVRTANISDAGNSAFMMAQLYGPLVGILTNTVYVIHGSLLPSINPLLPDGGSTGGEYTTVASNLTDGDWHLVESTSLGLGRAQADIYFAVDGVEVARFLGRRMAPGAASDITINLGGIYANGPFMGTIDYDDLYVSTRAPPSKLELSGSTSVAVGACSPFTVRLTSSLPLEDGGPPGEVTAFYDMSIEVTGVPIYLDSSCQASPASVDIRRNLSSGTFFSRFPLGATTLTATQLGGGLPDVLSASLVVTGVGSDGGADAGRDDAGADAAVDAGDPDAGSDRDAGSLVGASLRVGCGCSPPSGEWPAFLGLFLVCCRVRRRTSALPHGDDQQPERRQRSA